MGKKKKKGIDKGRGGPTTGDDLTFHVSGNDKVVDQILNVDLSEESSPVSQTLEFSATVVPPEQCPHASRAIRVARLIKKLKSDKRVGDCKDCEKEKKRSKSLSKAIGIDSSLVDGPSPIEGTAPTPITSWICLYCFETRCGRYDKGHAQAHFESNRHFHCLVMNLDNLDFWCYQCDSQLESGPKKNATVWGAKRQLALLFSKPLPKPFLSDSTGKVSEFSVNDFLSKPTSEKDLVGSKRPEMGHCPGLVNLGNTCFFNSVCQCLIHTPSLQSHFANAIASMNEKGVSPSSMPLTLGLQDLLLNMNKKLENGWGDAFNPKALFQPLSQKWRVYAQLRQQDSHELLLRLLDGISEEIKKNTSKDTKSPTIAESLFGGQLTSCIVCDVCKDVSETQEDYLILSVSIPTGDNLPSSPLDPDELAEQIHNLLIMTHNERLLHPIQLSFSRKKNGAIRLEYCLAQFMEVEVLNNQRACEKCYKLEYGVSRADTKKNHDNDDGMNRSEQHLLGGDHSSSKSPPPPLIRKSYKRYLLKSTPPFLVIHLKRFQQTGGFFGRTQKIDSSVEFDEYLDTAPFIMPSIDTSTISIYCKTHYRIYGVVVHSGSIFGGHYIAYIRHRQASREDQWVYCSDSHTRVVPWDLVKKCQAYMLFYERVTADEAP